MVYFVYLLCPTKVYFIAKFLLSENIPLEQVELKKTKIMKKSFMKWFLPLCMLLMMVGCKECIVNPPTVSTDAISSISSTTALVGGEVTTDGGAVVTDRGVCWNTSTGPTIANNPTQIGTGIGTFSITLSGLTPGATYYLKAYATNSQGTAYGNEVTFSTSANPSTITTSAVTAITTSSATSGGIISSDGGGAVTARGVCWNTTSNPTISNSKTSDGTGIGSFVSSITGLNAGVKYYIRAYSTNSAGTSYGNEQSFATSPNLPTVTTTAATTITATTATSGGNVTADGGGTVTAKGVCWSTTTGPSISNTKTSDGTGTGIYNSSLASLTANTTYYLRAYATNSAGTAYGSEVSFKTSANLPTVSTTIATSVTSNTASSGGNVTSDGGSAITARGVCWSNSTAPTITGSKTTVAGTTGVFTSSLTGLTSGTTYYVRAYATNSAGTSYGNEITFQTVSPTGTVTDIEGNVYKYVTIGTQVWFAENLKTTKYNDGSNVPLVTDKTSWFNLATPAYCWYNNDAETYKGTFGAMYNWYTVNTGKLCPTGWHVPSDADWTILTNFLGGINLAGGKLKETGNGHWVSPNTGATNETGFTSVAGGDRNYYGEYINIGYFGIYWSSSDYSITEAWTWNTVWNYGDIARMTYIKRYGIYVRCLKN